MVHVCALYHLTLALAPCGRLHRPSLGVSRSSAVLMQEDSWSFTQLMTALTDARLRQASVTPDAMMHTVDINGQSHVTQLLPTQVASVADKFADNAVDIVFVSPTLGASLLREFAGYLPFLALIFIIYNSVVSGMGGVLQSRMAQSNGGLSAVTNVTTTFDDVAGLSSVKEELFEVVECLRSPQKFADAGARVPKGVILDGPPGTGKTLLARAVAGEAGVPFLAVSASSFVEMYVGLGAARVRALFKEAKKLAPCIVWIDEIDAVARARSSSAGGGGGSEERETTLNELLVGLDGFDPSDGIVVLAATNRIDILDDAILRPGRFDRRVSIPLPDVFERADILKVHSRDKTLSDDVSLEDLAADITGFSGADIANLMNEAAIRALRRQTTVVTRADLDDALDRVIAGMPRASAFSPHMRLRVAVHEAGHAIVAVSSKGYDSLSRITIVPRTSGAGGFTAFTPTEDRALSGLYTREYLLQQITVLLGGRIAEEIVLGAETVSTGASDDLRRVYDIARRMVTEYGMGNTLVATASAPSNGAQIEDGVDRQINEIVANASAEARRIITAARRPLDTIVMRLLKDGSISGASAEDIITGE